MYNTRWRICDLYTIEKASVIFDPCWYAKADECVYAGVAYARESVSRELH